MQLARTTLVLVLGLILDHLSVHAQNLTLRFFQTGLQEDSCSYSNTSHALTFTTSSIPLITHCFDISSLFSGNTFQGFANHTDRLAPGNWTEDPGIHWQLHNMESYNPQANYSGILYRQHVSNPVTDHVQPGEYAARRVTIYSDKGCTEKEASDGEGVLPWYGFDCWSEEEGSCGTVSYNIASFSIAPGLEGNGGTCWVLAELGAAASLHANAQVVMVLFMSTALAIWLAM